MHLPAARHPLVPSLSIFHRHRGIPKSIRAPQWPPSTVQITSAPERAHQPAMVGHKAPQPDFANSLCRVVRAVTDTARLLQPRRRPRFCRLRYNRSAKPNLSWLVVSLGPIRSLLCFSRGENRVLLLDLCRSWLFCRWRIGLDSEGSSFGCSWVA